MNSLEFAIKMELDGEQYYLEQAELNKDNSLKNVFMMLANDEKKHAEVLQNKLIAADYVIEKDPLSHTHHIFSDIGNFKDVIKVKLEQLDLYRTALENEKKSIDLYEKLLGEATSEKDQQLYKFLIEEETGHFKVIEEIVAFLKRTDDWVENAEFGNREEY